MVLKSGLGGAVTVLLMTPAGEGDERHLAKLVLLASLTL
jgi:hypothetical protein